MTTKSTDFMSVFQQGLDMMNETGATRWMTQMFPASADSDWTKAFDPAAAFSMMQDAMTLNSDLPKFDTVFGVEKKIAAYTDAGAELATTTRDYQLLFFKSWLEAWQQFSTAKDRGQVDGGSSAQEFVDSWLSFANTAMLQNQRSQEFLEAQRRMINSLTEYRVRERDLVEMYQEQAHVPTRTEVDDLSKSVYELKSEVRRLKKELGNLTKRTSQEAA